MLAAQHVLLTACVYTAGGGAYMLVFVRLPPHDDHICEWTLSISSLQRNGFRHSDDSISLRTRDINNASDHLLSMSHRT